MPELPEVETICRRLRPLLTGKILSTVTVFHPKRFQGDPDLLRSTKITSVSRRAKILQLDFSGGYHLLIHLKMTGQLIFESTTGRVGGGHPTADFTNPLPSPHTRAILVFQDGSQLFFNDQRLFGWMRVVSNHDLSAQYTNLALDITDPRYTLASFLTAVSGRTAPIKQVIMDNTVVAGVGNIYACDALHLAQLDPRKSVASLSAPQLKRLLASMKTVIELGIEHQGATVHSFGAVEGLTGTYQDIRRVYQRAGEPCPTCSTPIIKILVGGRGTFLCPVCQR